jgi:hypothetical protein
MRIAYSGAELKMENVNRTGNGSRSSSQASNSATSETPDASDGENRSGESSAKTGSDMTSNVKSATGPRTQLGKERSKHNALKHGVFSNIIVLKGESRMEFDSLLNGFREDYQPEGTLEEILVEKLAMILWRQRRVLIAEGAEIRKGADLFEPALIDRIGDPQVRKKCLLMLDELQRRTSAPGFCPVLDEPELRELYGETSKISPRKNLYEIYQRVSSIFETSGEDPSTRQACKFIIGKEIQTERDRLRNFQKEHAVIAEEQLKFEKLRQYVPDHPRAERLLRYEASLERNFDRALNQLERAQRIRKGQAVLPTVKLDISQ